MSDLRVTVVGDVMLDVSEHGEATRISPEAPVVVLLNPVASYALGGAANTAANTLSLGVPTTIVGAVGDDDAGRRAEELATEAGLDPRLVVSATVPTTVKRRFLANNHQIMRLDVEAGHLPVEDRSAILTALDEGALGTALVISDYDKGVIGDDVAAGVVARAREAGVAVVVDTKRLDVSCFHGATIIAPNHLEATRMTGTSDPERAAEAISARTGGAVLVTLGAEGMLLFDGGRTTRIPSHARDVADVTGAGDTVTAGLAVALAEGRSTLEAAEWANWAAAEAVSHVGTYAVPREAVDRLIGS